MRTAEKILDFIKKYIKNHGYTPSYAEICDGVNVYSKQTVNKHMKGLLQSGKIESDVTIDGEDGAILRPRAVRVKGQNVIFWEYIGESDPKEFHQYLLLFEHEGERHICNAFYYKESGWWAQQYSFLKGNIYNFTQHHQMRNITPLAFAELPAEIYKNGDVTC